MPNQRLQDTAPERQWGEQERGKRDPPEYNQDGRQFAQDDSDEEIDRAPHSCEHEQLGPGTPTHDGTLWNVIVIKGQLSSRRRQRSCTHSMAVQGRSSTSNSRSRRRLRSDWVERASSSASAATRQASSISRCCA